MIRESGCFASQLQPGDYILCPHLGGTERVLSVVATASRRPGETRARVVVRTEMAHDRHTHRLLAYRHVGLSPIGDPGARQIAGQTQEVER